MDLSEYQPTKRGRGRPRTVSIRCADCGADCKNEREFNEHICIPTSIDYVAGTTVGVEI